MVRGLPSARSLNAQSVLHATLTEITAKIVTFTKVGFRKVTTMFDLCSAIVN